MELKILLMEMLKDFTIDGLNCKMSTDGGGIITGKSGKNLSRSAVQRRGGRKLERKDSQCRGHISNEDQEGKVDTVGERQYFNNE